MSNWKIIDGQKYFHEGYLSLANNTAERRWMIIQALRKSLCEVKAFAEGHHADEESHVWLHGLTVDIPAMIESALYDETNETKAKRSGT